MTRNRRIVLPEAPPQRTHQDNSSVNNKPPNKPAEIAKSKTDRGFRSEDTKRHKSFLLMVRGKVLGPFASESVISGVASGQFTEETLAYHDEGILNGKPPEDLRHWKPIRMFLPEVLEVNKASFMPEAPPQRSHQDNSSFNNKPPNKPAEIAKSKTDRGFRSEDTKHHKSFLLMVRGKVLGPFASESIISGVASGQFTEETLAYRDEGILNGKPPEDLRHWKPIRMFLPEVLEAKKASFMPEAPPQRSHQDNFSVNNKSAEITKSKTDRGFRSEDTKQHKSFLLMVRGKVLGPFASESIISGVASGQFTEETLAYHDEGILNCKPPEDLRHWKPIRMFLPEVLEVKKALQFPTEQR